MTDRLSELAKALADASDRLNGTNHRDDQRLMEEVATRIQARVDDYDAAYAALEAYGLEKASEGFDQAFVDAVDAGRAAAGERLDASGQSLPVRHVGHYQNGLDD